MSPVMRTNGDEGFRGGAQMRPLRGKREKGFDGDEGRRPSDDVSGDDSE